MDPPRTIAIVGRGRLGRSVLHALRGAGLPVTDVGRGEPIPPAGTTWLLVPDRAIAEVARAVPSGGILLHSSGALGPEVLAPHEHAAVLHPIMSFSGGAMPHPVPATITGSRIAVDRAKELAETIGWDPVPFDGERALYHAACVIAGNFGATIFAEACKALVLAGVDPREAPALLGPLARTSLDNAIRIGPSAMTGPLSRGDRAVVERHLQALAREPALHSLYAALASATEALVRQKGA
jgi:predicted short-subunit dehydrogenase-like oxidoreductase (DUF2520 family)